MRPLTVFQPERLGQWPGCDADGPDQRACGHGGAVGEPDLAVGGLLEGGVQPYVEPAAAQDAQGRACEPRVQLGQDRRGVVDQQPAKLVGVDPRVPAQRGPGEQLSLGGHFGAGGAGADHHEGAPGLALGRVVAGVGELQLPEYVVAQIQGLGDIVESLGLLQDPGDRQGPGYAAWRQNQPVPAKFAALPVGACHGEGAVGEVGADGVARDVAGAPQRARQGDRDVARIDSSGADLRQQRRVRHVIGRGDDHDLRRPARQPAFQVPRAVISGITRADNHDPGRRAGAVHELLHAVRILPCD